MPAARLFARGMSRFDKKRKQRGATAGHAASSDDTDTDDDTDYDAMAQAAVGRRPKRERSGGSQQADRSELGAEDEYSVRPQSSLTAADLVASLEAFAAALARADGGEQAALVERDRVACASGLTREAAAATGDAVATGANGAATDRRAHDGSTGSNGAATDRRALAESQARLYDARYSSSSAAEGQDRAGVEEVHTTVARETEAIAAAIADAGRGQQRKLTTVRLLDFGCGNGRCFAACRAWCSSATSRRSSSTSPRLTLASSCSACVSPFTVRALSASCSFSPSSFSAMIASYSVHRARRPAISICSSRCSVAECHQ